MKATDFSIRLIKYFEGFRSEAYLCPAGKWTIGYGTTLIDGFKVTKGMKCTEEEAEHWVWDEVYDIEIRLKTVVSPIVLSQNKVDAIVDFCYNLGIESFKGSTMLKLIKADKISLASNEFPKWDKAKVDGKYVSLPGLTKRRLAEKHLFDTGKLPEYIT